MYSLTLKAGFNIISSIRVCFICVLSWLFFFYFVVSNWLAESLNQLLFISLHAWNLHIVKLKLLMSPGLFTVDDPKHATSVVHSRHATSVVQVNKMLGIVSE